MLLTGEGRGLGQNPVPVPLRSAKSFIRTLLRTVLWPSSDRSSSGGSREPVLTFRFEPDVF